MKGISQKRPVNLNFFTIQFPIAAVISVLHRISGLVLILCIPSLLWCLQISLESQQRFNSIGVSFDNPWIKGVGLLVLLGFIYHYVAGIRHLLMDMGIGETKAGSRASAYCTLLITIILGSVGFLWLM